MKDSFIMRIAKETENNKQHKESKENKENKDDKDRNYLRTFENEKFKL